MLNLLYNALSFLLRILVLLSRNFAKLIYNLWVNRIQVAVFVIILGLLNIGQGQDMLMSITQNLVLPGLLYAVIGILAVLTWYMPKAYVRVEERTNDSKAIWMEFQRRSWFTSLINGKSISPESEEKNGNQESFDDSKHSIWDLYNSKFKDSSSLERTFPRVFGASFFILVASSLLNLVSFLGEKVLINALPYFLINLIIIAALARLGTMSVVESEEPNYVETDGRLKRIIHSITRQFTIVLSDSKILRNALLFLSIAFVIGITVLFFGNNKLSSLDSLKWLAYGMTAAAYLFLWLTTYRSKYRMLRWTYDRSLIVQSAREKKKSVQSEAQEAENQTSKIFRRIILLAVSICSFIFILSNFHQLTRQLQAGATLVIFICGLIAYTSVLNWLMTRRVFIPKYQSNAIKETLGQSSVERDFPVEWEAFKSDIRDLSISTSNMNEFIRNVECKEDSSAQCNSVLNAMGEWKRIQWITIAIILSFIMASRENDFHDLRRNTYDKQLSSITLEEHIESWLLHHKKEIMDSTRIEYPVIIANSHGGGLRAAAWTEFSLTQLEDTLESLGETQLSDHLYSLSGASGGTIGNTLIAARIKTQENGKLNYTKDQLIDRYSRDYMTASFAAIIGRDFIANLIGKMWVDRAAILEQVFEEHCSVGIENFESIKDDFYKSWCRDILSYDGKLTKENFDYRTPLIFSNTIHVESGNKAVISPVNLENNSNFFRSTLISPEDLKKRSVPLMTAAFLSARFPYVCPAGKLDDTHHFLDGGTKENSGAATSMEIYNTWIGMLEKPEYEPVHELIRKCHFIFLSLNSSRQVKKKEHKNLLEISAPAVALFNTRSSFTRNSEEALCKISIESKIVKSSFFLVDDLSPIGLEDRLVVLPVGWQMSEEGLDFLWEAARCGENRVILGEIAQMIMK